MASAKIIRNRIRSVKNTRKITRTMEMVATSKLKRSLERVTQSRPYMDKLREMLADLTSAASPDLMAQFPLLQKRETKRVLIFCLTANRGLCGGFNSNIIRRTRQLYDEHQKAGHEVDLHVAGRKGIGFFRFQGLPMAGQYTDLSDRPTFEDADRFAKIMVDAFLTQKVDKVFLVFAHFKSALQQPPMVVELLPIAPGEDGPVDDKGVQGKDAKTDAAHDGGEKTYTHNFLFKPTAEQILGALFPMYVRNMVYRTFIESVASEQSARRMAMKNATDNARDVITNLTREYNRARQALITRELTEIVGTAAALD